MLVMLLDGGDEDLQVRIVAHLYFNTGLQQLLCDARRNMLHVKRSLLGIALCRMTVGLTLQVGGHDEIGEW